MEMTPIAGLVMFRVHPKTHLIEFLLLKKPKPPCNWSLPKGHVELGEEVLNAAIRETREETGLLPHHYTILANLHQYFEYKAQDGAHKSVNLWPAQLLCWDQSITISKEHSDYKWIDSAHCLDFIKNNYAPIFTKIMKSIEAHVQIK